MSILSSSRRGTAFSGIAALLMAVSLVLAGCGNDNPAQSGGTMSVDIRGITQSMGASGFSSMATGVDESPSTTAVKSLIIGAVVITFTDSPLTSDTNINDDLSDKLATDVINSVNYFSIVDLPTSEDFVEFKVPPPGAGNWQVAAIGTREQILTFEDLDNENVAIYYGFTPRFFTTDSDTGPTVDIEMKRACFIDSPPKGCASFGDDGDILITPTVTIVDILKNNVSVAITGYAYGTPITDAATVMNAINTDSDITSVTGGDELTVVVTHPDAPGMPAACATVNNGNYESFPECTGTFVTSYE